MDNSKRERPSSTLRSKNTDARGGVVHSFTGTEQEAKELVSAPEIMSESPSYAGGPQMDMGFYIGCGTFVATACALLLTER